MTTTNKTETLVITTRDGVEVEPGDWVVSDADGGDCGRACEVDGRIMVAWEGSQVMTPLGDGADVEVYTSPIPARRAAGLAAHAEGVES